MICVFTKRKRAAAPSSVRRYEPPKNAKRPASVEALARGSAAASATHRFVPRASSSALDAAVPSGVPPPSHLPTGDLPVPTSASVVAAPLSTTEELCPASLATPAKEPLVIPAAPLAASVRAGPAPPHPAPEKPRPTQSSTPAREPPLPAAGVVVSTRAGSAPPESRMKLHGNESVWGRVRNFIHGGTGFAIITGPVGIGKSAGIRILAHQLGRQIVDFHGVDTLVKRADIETTATRESFGGKVLVVLEDVDVWSEGSLPALKSLCKRRDLPAVLCTATDLYAASLRGVRESVSSFRLARLEFDSVRAMVRWHVPSASDITIRHARDVVKNDVRQLLFRVKYRTAAAVDSKKNVFEATRSILDGEADVASSLRSLESQDQFAMRSLIFENYADGYKDLDALAVASDALSTADLCPSAESSLVSLMHQGKRSRVQSKLRFSMIKRTSTREARSADLPRALGGPAMG